jgi:hypothetical protein
MASTPSSRIHIRNHTTLLISAAALKDVLPVEDEEHLVLPCTLSSTSAAHSIELQSHCMLDCGCTGHAFMDSDYAHKLQLPTVTQTAKLLHNSQVVITTVKLLHNNSQAQTILCYCLLLHTAAYWHRPHSLHIYTITLSLTRQTIYPSIHSFIL